MADFGSPVVQPPDPNQGLNSLSSLMGLQSKKIAIAKQQQDLQTGMALQQTARAQAQQETQTANQRSAIANVMQNFDPTQHVGSDGTLNLDAVLTDPKLRAAAGDQFPAVAKQFADIKNTQLDAKSKLASLNGELRGQFTSAIGSLASDPDVQAGNPAGAGKVQEAVNNFAQTGGPDAARVAAAYAPVLQHAPPGKLGSILQNIQLQATDASRQADLQNPQPISNAAGQNINRNKRTGAETAPELGPGVTNPASSTVAGATNRQVSTGNADVDTANQVVAGQRDAKANIDLTKRIDQLSEVVSPGAAPAKVSQALGALGLQDINQARTELQKDLGRLRGNVAGRAGSDQRAASILEGLPTDTSPTQTIHQAMDVTRGMAKQDLALGKLRDKNAASTNGQMTGFQGDYAHAVSAASPLMHEYLSLSPADQVGFFKRNFATKEQAKAFRDQAESAKRNSPNVIGQ